MKRVTTVLCAFASLSMACVASGAFAAEADRPADRVVAMYFHRTERCPTCLKMGSYTEEAIKKGFAKQLKAGTVELHYVDFQDKKNAAIAKAYKITGPALIIAKVRSNKVKEYKNLTDIWTKVRKKEEFVSYVRENVATRLK